MNDAGWKTLDESVPRSRVRVDRKGRPAKLPESLRRSPFGRLVRTNMFNAAGDGAVALALAGSIFFSIDPSAARWRVALYLVCTIAPFAVVTPLIGPLLDRVRGGRRAMIVGSLALRSLLAFLMIRHTDTLWLFPEAFGVLVSQKAYGIAKSAVVPQLVPDADELVESNSRLTFVSGISGAVGAGVGGLFSLVGGPGWSALVACGLFAAGAVVALKIPKIVVADRPTPPDEKRELRSRGIMLAATAMAALRAAVGFVTFLLAFELRGGEDGVPLEGFASASGAAMGLAHDIPIEKIAGVPGAPTWHFGVVAVAAGASALIGARTAPRLREQYPEENILMGVLLIGFSAALLAAWAGDLFGAVLIAGAIGVAATTGKLAFDAIVQRDAPAANWGRSFARFEARFQLSWAIGAFIPAVAPLTGRASIGYLVVAVGLFCAGCWYFFGSRGYKGREPGTTDDSHLLSDDEFRPSLPRPPAGTAQFVAGGTPPALNRTIPQFEPTEEFAVARPDPERDSGSDDAYSPVISAADGVEVDD